MCPYKLSLGFLEVKDRKQTRSCLRAASASRGISLQRDPITPLEGPLRRAV